MVEYGPTTEFKRYQFSITCTGDEARRMYDWFFDSDTAHNMPAEALDFVAKLREIATR